MEKNHYLFTSESVSAGHPDKVCDQISDAILDAYLEKDPEAHVACETLCTTNYVCVAGEITSSAEVDVEKVVRDTIREIGYTKDEYNFNADTCRVDIRLHKQSPDINQGVSREKPEEQGAGDQGIMFGYAIDEGPEYMPLPLFLSHLTMATLNLIREFECEWLRPDAKCQYTLEYDEHNNPVKIDTIVLSTQHDEDISLETIRHMVQTRLIPGVVNGLPEKIKKLFDCDYKLFVNPTGKFVIGGPDGDCGLTGRKIIVDTYGGRCPHGGGAFCVDGDTEYLSEEGWKKISEYNGEKVAQWEDYKISFVEPLVYHNHPAEKMYHIYDEHTLDMVLSEHHDIVYETSKGNIIKKPVKNMIDGNNIKNGNNGFIPTGFTYDGGDGINLSDNEIKLQIAFCADGCMTETQHSPNIHVKKEYKKAMIEYLLNETGIEYKKSSYDDGYTRYYFNPPIKSKSISDCFRGANRHQLEVIADELVNWDGDRDVVYRTTNKNDADFAQFVFASVTGNSASIVCDNRIGQTRIINGVEYPIKSNLYEVRKLQYSKTSFRNSSEKDKRHIFVNEYETTDGRMYCFTVPSGMLLLRRNDKIFVTGNCGKDPSKVDRSAAYMARYVAKNLVSAGVCKECLIQLGYAIGVAQPVSVNVDTHGTAIDGVTDYDLSQYVMNNFDLTPYGIVNTLNLKNPIYRITAPYGHFGRKWVESDGLLFFPWERTDRVNEIRNDFNIPDSN